MTAKNSDCADLWGRVMDKQERRRQAAVRDKALEIVEAQRRLDRAKYINDRDILVRLYGDRDTRIAKCPVKLCDADRPMMPEPANAEPKAEPKEDPTHSGFAEGVLVGICTVMFVALMGVMAGVLFMV